MMRTCGLPIHFPQRLLQYQISEDDAASLTAALASNVWSFAGESDRADINQFLLQYFINCNFGETGWYLVSEPIMTADWMRDEGDRSVLPIGGAVGRVFDVGAQPVNMSVQAYDNVINTEGGADWQLRFQV